MFKKNDCWENCSTIKKCLWYDIMLSDENMIKLCVRTMSLTIKNTLETKSGGK